MKRENKFSRSLSAILILFGFSAFAWADGACDPSKYRCVDLSVYDNSHPVLKDLKPQTPDDREIPNDGKISKTSGNVFEDKRQVINFSEIPILDIQNQKDSLKTSFGGEGTWVFGDIVTAGNPIMESMNKGGPGDQEGLLGHGDNRYWVGAYINDGGIKDDKNKIKTFNSSKDTINLPKGVTKEDIVFAKLYWFGQVYTNEGLPNSWDSNGILEVKDIVGYQDVKLKIKVKDKDKDYDIKRDRCQGIFAYNSERATTGIAPYKDNKKRYNLNYACSTDITEKVKENFKDFEDKIEIAVGNIVATPYSARLGDKNNGRIYPSNQIYRISDATKAENIDGGFKGKAGTENAPLLPFGGWYVVLVYDKTMQSQAEFRGLDFPNDTPNDTKWAKAREAKVDGDPKEHLKKFFKAKNVTLYDGYLSLEPPSSGATSINTDFNITGFFTPNNGDVQGKLIVASFGSNYGITNNKEEGIFVSKEASQLGTDNSRLKLASNYHTDDIARRNTFFNGTKSRLLVGDDGKYIFDEELSTGKKSYYQGYDLDEFDISDRLGKGQSDLSVRISEVTLNGGSNRAMVPFLGLSIDIYVPNLCYEQELYDTKGWLGFYDRNGNPIEDHGEVPEIKVVTGENLYYRTEIRNQEYDKNGNAVKDGEDALGVWVKVNTGQSNTYVANSSGIDNVPKPVEPENLQGLKDAKFVFLQDNTPGAYSTQAKRYIGGDPDVTETPYKDKQLNTLQNKELKFYLGEDAGVLTDNAPVGGKLKYSKSVYLEFNATIGRTFTYTPIQYTVGYAMNLGGKTVQGPTSIMERCKEAERTVEIQLLNGLKIVNQNFKDYGESETDKNKTASQDDRLYTQVAELPFNVNMIFRPDINDVFKGYCVEQNEEGKCFYHSDSFDICENYAGIFEKTTDGKCKAREYKKLPDGTWGIKYLVNGNEKLDGTLQIFSLPGDIYLSAIRSGSGCKYVDDGVKLPFLVNGERYMTDYLTNFATYQDPAGNGTNTKKVMPIEKVEFEDAFDGVTFMFSYYPRGLGSSGTDTNQFLDENGTYIYGQGKFIDENGTTDMAEYYIYLQTQILYEKYIKGYKRTLSDERKQELIDEWYAKTDPKTMEDRRNFEAELDNIKIEIRDAKAFFGTDMSPDGSFHVCDSDSFVVRPAYFKVDMNNANKYAKLIDANATGDITKAATIRHERDYRVGGNHNENIDILKNMIYASSNKNHPVPNYYAIIGGDFGTSRFSIRTSYDLNSASFTDDKNITTDTVWREEKTYLKPFISTDCYASLSNYAFFTEKEIKDRSSDRKLYRTDEYNTDDCTINKATEYTGFEVDEYGRYKFATEEVDKERTSAKRSEIGQATINEKCKVNGKTFSAENYTKVWDKNGVSMLADFGVKDTVIKDGSADITRFSGADLVGQGILEPQNKKFTYAVLSTGGLVENSKLKGLIFNYFNVGDVLVSVYDNSWTDAHGDQTFDKRKGPDGNYWGSTCIINSTSNIPDELGKVGCDVGMKDNQELVLRFRPDRVNLAIEGLATEGINADITGNNDFVYYNSPDIPNDIRRVNKTINKSMIRDFANLGRIKFKGEAYLSDSTFKDTIATLYDGTLIHGKYDDKDYEVAKCGFASSMNVDINFGFDCNDPRLAADQRCATDAQIEQTLQNTVYAPYVGQSDINYTIPAGTNFMTNCNNNNGISDSRCFRYNVKGGNLNAVGNIDTNSLTEAISGNGQFNNPLPINFAANYYTDVNKEKGFINRAHQVSGKTLYDPKNPSFELLARSFKEGTTQDATIYLNFDRMQKSPHLPLYVFATDFTFEDLDLNGTIEPAKFNFDNMLINENGDVLIGEAGKDNEASKFTGKPYIEYENFNKGSMKETNATFVEYAQIHGSGTTPITEYLTRTGNVPAILFAYGKANESNDGEIGIGNTATYEDNVANAPIPVRILDALFCNKANGCALTPNIVLNGENLTPMVPNIFAALRTNRAPETKNGSGFTVNILGKPLANPNIKNIWVEGYYPDATSIDIARNNPNLTNGVEPIFVDAVNINGTKGPVTVEVLTRPWLIYTPHKSDVFVDTTKTMGNPIQYYNYFSVNLIDNTGQWGGEGQIKGTKEEGDIGSFITGKDFQDIAKGENQTPSIRNDRIDW